jgi:glycosyltransferase involved in cell wall biosynthesis
LFIDAAGPVIPYEDPWQISYEDRLSALATGEKRVAYFYEWPDAHTFRYRVFNMVEALGAHRESGISASWFTNEDREHGCEFVDRADVLVICRTRYDSYVGRVIARARARGIPIFYDVDDLIFDIRYAHVIGNTINRSLETSEEWDWWIGYIGRLGATLQLCDGAITTNALLGSRIADFAPWITPRILPNFYNRRQEVISRAIYQRKCSTTFQRDGNIHVGYFSGTNTHGKDFRIVSGALSRLLVKNPRLIVRIVGSTELSEQISLHRGRVETYPVQDFVNLQRLQGEIEVCIAPVQNTAFTNCKSDLKYFEPALMGTVVIASPVFAFQQAIRDGDNGFLAHTHEWEQKLEEVISIAEESAHSYRMLSDRAFAHVKRQYDWRKQGPNIAAVLFSETECQPGAVP